MLHAPVIAELLSLLPLVTTLTESGLGRWFYAAHHSERLNVESFTSANTSEILPHCPRKFAKGIITTYTQSITLLL